jgi:CO/xanthine dehydrogenase Mo-binding subunit
MSEELKVVGTNVPRIDALDKVTGAAKFVDDIQFGPGLLHAKLKRSPYPHARIVSIDTRKAEALPGVKVVVTGQDYPEHYVGLYLLDRTVYAVDRARFVGDPVAAVAAVGEAIAEQAVELIEVEYEELPGLFDPEEAAKPDAPLIHPDLGQYECAPFILPQTGTNISNYFRLRKGDVEAGFAQSDVIVEGTYRVPHVQHVPIETHVVAAQQDISGKITLWSSSQSPFAQRALIAKAFGLSLDQLRVITPYVGGGFGSKAGVSMEACVIPLAMKARGRPVKLHLTRQEEFYTSFVRQGLVAHIKMGVTKEGQILAQENQFYWDAGGYNEYGVNVVRAAGYSSSGPYEIPNLKTDSYAVYTNHPVGGPMRGFGMPEMHFCLEQHIDVVAERIGMDPVELRLNNAIREGALTPTGSPMHPTGFSDCIRKAARAIGWGKKRPPSAPHKRRGLGFAGMWKAPAMPPNPGSSATVKLNEDGTVNVSIGAVDLGQGALTVAAQMAAETLGVPMESVRVNLVDTDYSPYEWQTVASRITWSTGNAVVQAAGMVRRRILDLVAEVWDESPEDLTIIEGKVISFKSEREVELKDFAVTGLQMPDGSWRGGPILGEGSFMPTYVSGLDAETGQGERAVVHWTTGAQAVEVEVNTETGEIEVLKVSAAYDVGKAINPDLVLTQIEGGVVQGISTGLFEELKLEKGQPTNASLTDYKIATAVDAPAEIKGHIVEVPQDDGPWGARGVGEHTMVPTAPAIANAVYDALGVRITSLPLTAEKVYLALQEKYGTSPV